MPGMQPETYPAVASSFQPGLDCLALDEQAAFVNPAADTGRGVVGKSEVQPVIWAVPVRGQAQIHRPCTVRRTPELRCCGDSRLPKSRRSARGTWSAGHACAALPALAETTDCRRSSFQRCRSAAGSSCGSGYQPETLRSSDSRSPRFPTSALGLSAPAPPGIFRDVLRFLNDAQVDSGGGLDGADAVPQSLEQELRAAGLAAQIVDSDIVCRCQPWLGCDSVLQLGVERFLDAVLNVACAGMRSFSAYPRIAAIFAKVNDLADPRPPYAPRYRYAPPGWLNIGTSFGGISTRAVVTGDNLDASHGNDGGPVRVLVLKESSCRIR